MTVAELRDSMTVEEECGWLEYYQLKSEDEKAAMEAAKQRSSMGPRRR